MLTAKCTNLFLALASAASLGIVVVGCADNATRLSFGIERALRDTESARTGDWRTVPYRPKARPDEPYTLVFFPEQAVTPSDLVAAGVPTDLADRIFRDLDYVRVGRTPLLVVVQPGARLTFTSAWRRFTVVEELLVLDGVGTRELLLERKGDRWVVHGWAPSAPEPGSR